MLFLIKKQFSTIRIVNCKLVPSPRIELRTSPYHGLVLPLNYEGMHLFNQISSNYSIANFNKKESVFELLIFIIQ